MTAADLERAFKTYFDEIGRCTASKCYWALLHLVVVLPDICAALESPTGDSGSGGPYRAWCKENFAGGYLSAEDRYEIRCSLLHQGRTTVSRGRYASYSFVQPSPSGHITHNWVTNSERNITLDVGELARETISAMRTWFLKLLLPINRTRLANVQRNLPALAHEKPKTLSIPSGLGALVNRTYSST